MIPLTPGLVSITFRQFTPMEIIGWVCDAGLAAIEWGGDVHCPHGDVSTARTVGEATRAAGLEVTAYGSYYRVGHSEQEGLGFDAVLRSALALKSPVIRVWAGTRGSAEADPSYVQWVVLETRRIAALAHDAGVKVALEFHAQTLTDTTDSALRLLESVDHPALRSLWQPGNGWTPAVRRDSLRALAPWLEHVHVFHWTDQNARLPLVDGAGDWPDYLRELAEIRPGAAALLEFVAGDDPGRFLHDAATLKSWLE
jgi:sugar phosphate isomerase/epimerase